MAEKSFVQTAGRRSDRRIAVPRGWVVLALALASWAILGWIAFGLWSLATAL